MNTPACLTWVLFTSCLNAFAASVLSPRPNNTPLGGLEPPFVITGSQAPSVRFQQIYAAGDFQAVVAGPLQITELAFATVSGSVPMDIVIPNVVLHLSTSSKVPDGLSATFADNLGPDDMTVFSGSLHWVVA